MTEPDARPFRAEIVHVRALTPTVRSLVFKTDRNPALRWSGGQYVELEVIPGLKKPYSIASVMGAHGPNQFEIAVALSSGGEMFEAMQPGRRLEGFGPSGGLRRPRPNAPSVFLAAGTGLSPFRPMIHDELSGAGNAPVLLLFGCRTEVDILWRDELLRLAERHRRFRFEPTLSRAEPTWTGRRGWVQEHLKELVARHANEGADFYVCGVNAMVADCVRRLESELGVPRERIVTERN